MCLVTSLDTWSSPFCSWTFLSVCTYVRHGMNNTGVCSPLRVPAASLMVCTGPLRRTISEQLPVWNARKSHWLLATNYYHTPSLYDIIAPYNHAIIDHDHVCSILLSPSVVSNPTHSFSLILKLLWHVLC